MVMLMAVVMLMVMMMFVPVVMLMVMMMFVPVVMLMLVMMFVPVTLFAATILVFHTLLFLLGVQRYGKGNATWLQRDYSVHSKHKSPGLMMCLGIAIDIDVLG